MAKTTETARTGTRMLRGEGADSGEQPGQGFVHVLTITDFIAPVMPFVTVIDPCCWMQPEYRYIKG